ncbi:J domain-containing protein [Leptospira paudalimensis]|uniref:DnaJ domain-containing protein n=1 Tax=Leptospira paudalimensis TaxID=2950024 RepID=A0ABT3M7I3_9LEPT|nr:DnaJ domain-containing protein [Leptospira paudalimensis]MCW7503986.1 DnaJ domain-containing protein [Leptospira paudalimensis]
MPNTKRETFYEILGISRDFPTNGIEAVYLRELLFWEQLEKAGSQEAKDKILELTRAYLTLSDPNKRDVYDSELDFEFVLLDGKAKDPEMEEAYDIYRLGHKKTYQEILSEFSKFKGEMGDTLWVLKKTTIYLVINLLLYSGIVLFQSLFHQNEMETSKENDILFNFLSYLFLGFSGIGYLLFRFLYIPKQLKKRKESRL